MIPTGFSMDPPQLCDLLLGPSLVLLCMCQQSLKLTSIELVMPSNPLTLCHPLLLCFQSCPTSESFQMSQFFASGSQSIGISASASVLPMNIQATNILKLLSTLNINPYLHPPAQAVEEFCLVSLFLRFPMSVWVSPGNQAGLPVSSWG